MKLASYKVDGRTSFGVVSEKGIVDLGARLGDAWGSDIKGLIESGAYERAAKLADVLDADFAIEDVELLPVVPQPGKIVCVGVNYTKHMIEAGRDLPEHPWIFTRFADSLVGHGVPIIRPKASEQFDYEGELAVIIGRTARNVKADEALDYVAGYSCFNDGTLRDFQRHSNQFIPGKNFPLSGSFGPWMVTADEITDPSGLVLKTILNGEVMQHASTSDLIFSVPKLIEYCSTFTQLEQGDVIATGTPGGVGFARKPPVWMKKGDVIEVSLSSVGVLRNTVVDEE